MNILVQKELRFLKKLAGYHNSSCCTVADLVFLGLCNFNYHFGSRMFNLHLFKNCNSIISDNDVT